MRTGAKILAEILMRKGYMSIEQDNHPSIILYSEALEAIEEFGKQCYEDAVDWSKMKELLKLNNVNMEIPAFKDYLRSLEDEKEGE